MARPIYFTITGVGVQIVPLDVYLTPFQVSIECEVVTAATYGVETTRDNVQDPAVTPLWSNSDVAALNPGAVATQRGVQTTPVTALRVNVTVGGGSLKVRIVESGIR